MKLPLEGMTVVDLGTLTPGKYASSLLTQLGADVIRVERPGTERKPLSDEDLVLNRNKRSMVLDLRTTEGLKVLHKLIETTDVLLEANRPGVAERRGFGYEALSEQNPEIVYCSLSSFGQTGPRRNEPGYDLVFMGMSGVWQALLAGQSPPVAPGLFLADAVSGLVCAFASVTALLKRERGGGGTYIDVAMLDATFSLLATSHGVQRDSEPSRIGPSPAPGASPSYRTYVTADGSYIVLGAVRASSWRALCDVLGCPQYGDNPYPPVSEAAEIIETLSAAFKLRPADAWIERLKAMDIDCGPFNSPEAALDEHQLQVRHLLVPGTDQNGAGIRTIASPLNATFGAPEPESAPMAGAHTDEILRELGF